MGCMLTVLLSVRFLRPDVIDQAAHDCRASKSDTQLLHTPSSNQRTSTGSSDQDSVSTSTAVVGSSQTANDASRSQRPNAGCRKKRILDSESDADDS